MNKTNDEILNEIPEDNGVVYFTQTEVYAAMSAARKDELNRVREIVELRIYEIDGDKLMTAYAMRRRELEQLLKKLK